MASEPRHRRRRARGRLAATAAVVLALGAGVGAGAWLGADDAGPSVRVEELDGGEVRRTVEDSGVTVTLQGPATIEVGASLQLTVAVTGAQSWVWVGPDGAVQPGGDTFEMTAQSPGEATVRLLAVDDRGHPTEATHPLHVVA